MQIAGTPAREPAFRPAGGCHAYEYSLFSRAERKAALWAVIAALAVSAAGFAWDWAQGPSLGQYEDMGPARLVGVTEAKPLG